MAVCRQKYFPSCDFAKQLLVSQGGNYRGLGVWPPVQFNTPISIVFYDLGGSVLNLPAGTIQAPVYSCACYDARTPRRPVKPYCRLVQQYSWGAHILNLFLYCKQKVSLPTGEYENDGYSCSSCLCKLLEVLPVTSAECEHVFSQMNLCHNESRNRLSTSTVNDLLMIGI
jgi:hAT family C-terminal dimerisation region